GLEAAPGGVGDVGLDVPVRDGGGGDAEGGDGREGNAGLDSLIARKAGGDLRVDGGDAGRDLGDVDLSVEVDVHVGAVGGADAPRSRLEEDADVPGRAALPVAGEIGIGDVGEPAVEGVDRGEGIVAIEDHARAAVLDAAADGEDAARALPGEG